MSALPDPSPDLVTAAWREMKKQATALKVAGVGADAVWDPWLFAWKPMVTVNGSGYCSVVLFSQGGWTTPNRHNTARFPSLNVEVYADIDRDATRGPYLRTAQRKAEDVFEVIDHVFHRPDHGDLLWGNSDGTLRVVTSLRSSEPRIDEVPDTDGAQFLTVNYEIQM